MRWLLIAPCTGLCLLTLATVVPPPVGGLTTQIALVFDERVGRIVRKTQTAWNFNPDPALEFEWRPEHEIAGTKAAVSGRGTLIWRKQGASRYAADAVVSIYRGDMRDGRPHGHGSLRTRAGARYEGAWRSGRFDGAGLLQTPDGDSYTGAFKVGQYHGEGTLVLADGESFEGTFVEGLRHGEGISRFPSGASYRSFWYRGVETGDRRIRLAQAGTGGSLPSPVEAARVAVAVDWWQEEVMNYVGVKSAAMLTIRPDDRKFMGAWDGTGSIGVDFLHYGDEGVGTQFWPVPLKISLKNTSKQRLDIRRAFLEVEASVLDERPLYALWYKPKYYPEGCTDNFDLQFAFANFGWSVPDAVKFEFGFAKSAGASPATPVSALELRPSPKGTIVHDVAQELTRLRFDPDKLPADCPKNDAQCLAALTKSEAIGALAPAVRVSRGTMTTTAVGRLSYTWTDSKGAKHDAVSRFDFELELADYSGREPPMVTCAEGASPPDFDPGGRTRLQLDPDKAAYQVVVPFSGSLAPGQARQIALMLEAPKTSRHRFRVAFETASGHIIRSTGADLLLVAPPFSPTDWAQGLAWEEMKRK